MLAGPLKSQALPPRDDRSVITEPELGSVQTDDSEVNLRGSEHPKDNKLSQ